MKEYIEREAVMKEFANFVWDSNHSDLVPAPQWNHAIDIVRDFPAADVRPVVRGEWRHDGSRWANRWLCSVCGYLWVFAKEEAYFCPNCGAEMREEDSHED